MDQEQKEGDVSPNSSSILNRPDYDVALEELQRKKKRLNQMNQYKTVFQAVDDFIKQVENLKGLYGISDISLSNALDKVSSIIQFSDEPRKNVSNGVSQSPASSSSLRVSSSAGASDQVTLLAPNIDELGQYNDFISQLTSHVSPGSEITVLGSSRTIGCSVCHKPVSKGMMILGAVLIAVGVAIISATGGAGLVLGGIIAGVGVATMAGSGLSFIPRCSFFSQEKKKALMGDQMGRCREEIVKATTEQKPEMR
jgi:hypothetical protein